MLFYDGQTKWIIDISGDGLCISTPPAGIGHRLADPLAMAPLQRAEKI